MRTALLVTLLLLIAIGLGVASAAAHPASRPAGTTGVVEYQFTDDGPPHPAAVFKDAPWFGYAGARVYLSWADGDAEAVIYLPPPGCLVRPLRACASVCPAPITCFVGHSTYRAVTPADQRAVVWWDSLPFYPGGAGDPVRLVVPGDGTARWLLP